MRLTILTCLLVLSIPLPAWSWEFSALPLCTLRHSTQAADVVITHDPNRGIYRLDLSLSQAQWEPSDSFGITFSGARGLTIGTGAHVIDRNTLTVTDRGFGNVLNGLEFNRAATAFTAQRAVTISLQGAAGPVQQFRRCAEGTVPLS